MPPRGGAAQVKVERAPLATLPYVCVLKLKTILGTQQEPSREDTHSQCRFGVFAINHLFVVARLQSGTGRQAKTPGVQIARRQSYRVGEYQLEPMASEYGGRIYRR